MNIYELNELINQLKFNTSLKTENVKVLTNDINLEIEVLKEMLQEYIDLYGTNDNKINLDNDINLNNWEDGVLINFLQYNEIDKSFLIDSYSFIKTRINVFFTENFGHNHFC